MPAKRPVDIDSFEYLYNDFDISRLTVPDFRSVMLKHNIKTNDKWKREDFVSAFNLSLKPHAHTILSDHQNVIRSSAGIEPARSSRY